MSGIFSLLLQFYLNRQVAHHQDYVLNKEKLVAYAMAKRTYERANSESGEQSFNVGKSTYRSDEKFFTTTISTEKNQFEFRFPPLKKTDDKTKKTEKKSKEEQVKNETTETSKDDPSKNDKT